jgi:hypothetical protein
MSMTDADDRKMFAPLRNREAIAIEEKVVAILGDYEGGIVAAHLAERLVHARLAVGTRDHVTRRVGEMLDTLQGAGKVERTPDGRYRAVRGRR